MVAHILSELFLRGMGYKLLGYRPFNGYNRCLIYKNP